MVFFDQYRVIQANAVVGAAATAHRVLLGQTQAGQGFSGVHDVGLGARHDVDITRSFGGHAAE